MQHVDVFSIQMDGDFVVEGEDGQPGFCQWLYFELQGAEVAGRAALFQALADVVMGDNGRLLLEEFVSTNMIQMVMGVDDEAVALTASRLPGR